jgi:hypothetical protein
MEKSDTASTPPTDTPTFTTGEVEKILHISRATVSKMFDRGLLGEKKFFGAKNDRVITATGLLEFMNNHSIRPDNANMLVLTTGEAAYFLNVGADIIKRAFDKGKFEGYTIQVSDEKAGYRNIYADSLLLQMESTDQKYRELQEKMVVQDAMKPPAAWSKFIEEQKTSGAIPATNGYAARVKGGGMKVVQYVSSDTPDDAAWESLLGDAKSATLRRHVQEIAPNGHAANFAKPSLVIINTCGKELEWAVGQINAAKTQSADSAIFVIGNIDNREHLKEAGAKRFFTPNDVDEGALPAFVGSALSNSVRMA